MQRVTLINRDPSRNLPRADRVELVRDLAVPGCLVCRDKDVTERNWHNWYVIETHTDLAYRRHVARAGGFCPGHIRQLMETSDGRNLLPALFADVIDHLLGQPVGAAAAHVRCDPCDKMAWAEQRRIDIIARWVFDAEVRAALAGRLCLPHLLRVVDAAGWPVAAELVDLAVRQLSETGPQELTTVLVPSDPDLSRRARYLPIVNEIRSRSDKQISTLPTLDRVLSALDEQCCPVCRAGAHGELRYLAWLLDQDLERLDAGECWLCPAHLHDATALDRPATQPIATAMQRALLGRLFRLTAQLKDTPDPRIGRRLRAAWPHLRRREYDKARAPLQHPRTHVAIALRDFGARPPACAACAAGDLARRRELDLLHAASSHQIVRDHWACGHGPCAQHVLFAQRDPVPEQVLRSRLSLLAWELEETRRKNAWRTRHEPATAADDSWSRAVPFLCGDAYLGRTAREYLEQRVDQ